MHTSMTSTRSKIKVTELLKFRKLHFSSCIFSAILAWSSKLMVDYDNMGPSLQLVGARFLNFLLSQLSCDFRHRRMSILQDFKRAIFPYCLRLESHGRVCVLVVLCVLYMLLWPSPDPRSRSHLQHIKHNTIGIFIFHIMQWRKNKFVIKIHQPRYSATRVNKAYTIRIA